MTMLPGKEDEYRAYVEANSKNPYSRGIVDYSERWACLMENRITNQGKTVREIADSTSNEADTDGISGFTYGCAVASLAHFWVHGSELKAWHNLQYGVNEDAKGVVNPAIITFS